MRKSIILVGILILLIIVLIFFTDEKGAIDKTSSVSRADLVAEFEGTYVDEIIPNGNVVEINMIAEPSEVEIFDGYKTKVWAYNGTVPGPEIRIKLGDTLKMNFSNKLPQETTVHFHGVRVPNAMDGVPGVTQNAIKPGESFVYEFTPKDAGTFWFHPHTRTSEQVERGLFGVLIVEDEVDEKYSQDVVWVIDDWRMTGDRQVDERFNSPMDLMHDGRWGNVITVNGKLNEVLKARVGERIRLRMINTSNARIYAPDFSGLSAKVIAVDGVNVKEIFDADGFELSPGNRIDVDIEFKEKGECVIYDRFGSRKNKLASIKVSGEVVQAPKFDFPVNLKIPEWKSAFNMEIDKEYVLDAKRNEKGEIKWMINGKAYPEFDPYTLKYGEFNKIRFRNDSSRLHPMHLHGQFFKVIARDGVASNEQYFRDTVLIKPKETLDIALVPIDKGTWVNHCHILEHAEAGMVTAVTVE